MVRVIAQPPARAARASTAINVLLIFVLPVRAGALFIPHITREAKTFIVH
jgi:hypothetical protein